MEYIVRPEYMSWLRRWQDKSVIKIVSGIRRCGKSTLLKLFQEELISRGISSSNILSLNFEDVKNEPLCEYHAFHEFIVSHLSPNGMNYIFLDEIQHVDQFEKALDSLFLRDDCDIYVTGSNAYLMSSELGTLLTGRYVELKMLPFSFKEFLEGTRKNSFKSESNKTALTDQAFVEYINAGSFPYVTRLLDDAKTAMEYLSDIYSSVLLKDVVARLRIADVSLLERLTRVLASCVGSLVSSNKIANTLTSSGRKSDQKTVDKYIDGLVKSMLFYEVPRWDIKGRRILSRISKYYIVDTGLRKNLVVSEADDLGHMLENIVYLELLRRGNDVYIGSLESGEVDFVCLRDGSVSYIQVSASILDPTTLKRELASLKAIQDDYPKTIITLDRIIPSDNIEGISVVNAIDWLLD